METYSDVNDRAAALISSSIDFGDGGSMMPRGFVAKFGSGIGPYSVCDQLPQQLYPHSNISEDQPRAGDTLDWGPCTSAIASRVHQHLLDESSPETVEQKYNRKQQQRCVAQAQQDASSTSGIKCVDDIGDCSNGSSYNEVRGSNPKKSPRRKGGGGGRGNKRNRRS